jgi:predicted MFS family arabinose efflux permease
VDRTILVALCFLFAGLGMFGVFFGNYILACVSCFVWGLGTFASNSLQQSRLVGIAPALAAATVALNTSAVYLGQSVGAGTGGFAIKNGVSANVVWMALVFLVMAVVMSVAATKLAYEALR